MRQTKTPLQRYSLCYSIVFSTKELSCLLIVIFTTAKENIKTANNSIEGFHRRVGVPNTYL